MTAAKKTLSEVCEELCPGSRKRNHPAWAGPWKHDYEDSSFYVEQLGASWIVRWQHSGEVACFRPDKESAVKFCIDAASRMESTGGDTK